MKGLFIAIQFLTVIPLKLKSVTEKQIAWSMTYFPFVGYLIGLMLIAVYSILTFVGIQSYLLCLALVIFLIVITGGLHLDGLADTSDGFLSGKPSDDMLAIMRDSHIGTMGVLSLICIILAKVFLLHAIAQTFFITAVLLMCCISRWSMVLLMNLNSYARKDGKAFVYMTGRKKHIFILSSFIAMLLAYATWGFSGIVLMAFVSIAVVIFGMYCTKIIGGITGDTIGATNELVEVFVLIMILIMERLNPCLVLR